MKDHTHHSLLADAPTTDEVKKMILDHVPTDGEKIGNKSCHRLILRKNGNVTKELYDTAKRQLVQENILFTPVGGNGGSLCLYEFRGKHGKARKTVSARPQIQAILMSHPGDRNPRFLGRKFLDWESDPFHRVECSRYSHISSAHHVSRSGPYIACSMCRHPIIITGCEGSFERKFLHRKGAPETCPCRSQTVGNKGEALDQMFEKGDTSEEHEEAIRFIRNALTKQFPVVHHDDLPAVGRYMPGCAEHAAQVMRSQTVMLGPMRLDNAVRSQEDRVYRRPDIFFVLQHPNGSREKWAIEVQRSKMLTDDIRSRTHFYRKCGINLIWVVVDRLARSPTSRTCFDFQDIHRGRLIFLDEAAREAANTTGKLHLTFRAYDPGDDAEGLVRSADTALFPDEIKTVKNIVFFEDHLADTAERRASTARRRLKDALLPLSKSYGKNNVLARVKAEDDVLKLLRQALSGVRAAHDIPQSIEIESRDFRTVMVLVSMLYRMHAGNPSANLTTSFYYKDPYILSMDWLEASTYLDIIDCFSVFSGYMKWINDKLDKDFCFPWSPEKAIAQFKNLPTKDRVLLEAFLPEVFHDPTRQCLAEVNRLPCWAISSPFL